MSEETSGTSTSDVSLENSSVPMTNQSGSEDRSTSSSMSVNIWLEPRLYSLVERLVQVLATYLNGSLSSGYHSDQGGYYPDVQEFNRQEDQVPSDLDPSEYNMGDLDPSLNQYPGSRTRVRGYPTIPSNPNSSSVKEGITSTSGSEPKAQAGQPTSGGSTDGTYQICMHDGSVVRLGDNWVHCAKCGVPLYQ